VRASARFYLLIAVAILRQISGSEVPTIAIFKISPRINGVKPAEIVADHERSSEFFNQSRPKPKIVISPRIRAGNEVENF
jgi:hypothetical protein